MSRNADILILCQYYEPDMAAVGVVLGEVAEDLVRSGFVVGCLTAQPTYAGRRPAPKEEFLRGVRVRRVRAPRATRNRLAGRLLSGLAYWVQACAHVVRGDASTTLLISTSPPYLGLIGLAANLFFGQRYLYVVHDIYPELAVRAGFLRPDSLVANAWRWLENKVLSRASAIVVQGLDMRDEIRAKLPERLHDRIRVIALGADADRFRPLDAGRCAMRRQWGSDGMFVALYAGNMGVCHDLEMILEAADLLREEPIRFVFSGGGVKRARLEAVAKARRLSNVIFQDYVPADRVNELLASCDVGLVSVDRSAEGLLVPWKLYNLMAAGKAVVAVASVGSETGRTIEQARCGVLVEHGSADQLANGLRALERDRHRAVTMGTHGRHYLVANLSRPHRARQFARVVREIRAERVSSDAPVSVEPTHGTLAAARGRERPTELACRSTLA